MHNLFLVLINKTVGFQGRQHIFSSLVTKAWYLAMFDPRSKPFFLRLILKRILRLNSYRFQYQLKRSLKLFDKIVICFTLTTRSSNALSLRWQQYLYCRFDICFGFSYSKTFLNLIYLQQLIPCFVQSISHLMLGSGHKNAPQSTF